MHEKHGTPEGVAPNPTEDMFAAPGRPVRGIDSAMAMQILAPEPNRLDWLAMRRTGLGSSDVSALVGMNKYTSPYELWEDKTGRLPLVDEQSEAAEMGTLLEPVVRDRFARVHDLTVRQVGMLRSTQWPWMLANPDGLCSDGYGYEGKTCSLWKAHDWGTADEPLVPDHAELQAQWGMAVTGLPGWWVAVLIGGQRNVYRLVERDEQIIADLVTLSHRFWHEHVLADVEPAVDGSQAVTDLLIGRHRVATPGTTVEITAEERDALVTEREKLAAAERAAKTDHEALKNRVRAQLGDAEELVCDGRAVFTWKHTEKFAAARFAKAHPEKATAYLKPVTVVDTERLAAEEPDLYREFCSRELRFAG